MNDIVNEIFGNQFMDKFHDYNNPDSLWRYQHRQRAKIISEQIDKRARFKSSFLDAGAGRGAYSNFATNIFHKVYVFELDKNELFKSKKNLNQISKTEFIFDNVDLRNIPLPNESIDLIILSEVIEHVPDEQKALKEVNRVLKPNGIIIFSMPNSWSFYWQHQRLLFKYARANNLSGYSDWEAKRHFSFSFLAIRNLIKSENFKIIKTTGCTIIPLFPLLYGNLYKKFPSLLRFYSKIDEKLSRYFPFLCASYFLILSKKRVKN